MPRKKDGRKVISVILTDKEYEQIKLLAAKSMYLWQKLNVNLHCKD